MRNLTFLLFFMFLSAGNAFEPCSIQQKIPSENDRSKDDVLADHISPLCDQINIKPEGEWFRSAYELVSGRININTCGTKKGIWLYGHLPTVADGVVNRRMCVRGEFYDCEKTYTISVKNCGTYKVYFLPQPTACPEAYCFEKNPCDAAAILPYQSVRMTNYIRENSEGAICDKKVIKKSGEWFRTTEDMANVSRYLACGTEFGIWMQGEIPSFSDGEVFRNACVVGKESDCQKNYNIKVKNCGTFRAYFLPQPTDCPEAYCFGYGLPDSAPTISLGKPSVNYEMQVYTGYRYRYEKLTLECQFHFFADITMHYQVYWFANNELLNITDPVPKEDMITASLTKETGLKINTNVQCMVSLRYSTNGIPGPLSPISESKFIGIMVHNMPLRLRRGSQGKVSFSLTVPFECAFIGDQDVTPMDCILHLEIDIPRRANCSTSPGNCFMEIKRSEWNKTFSIDVMHVEENYQSKFREFFIQFRAMGPITSPVWGSIQLPLVKVLIEENSYWTESLCTVFIPLNCVSFNGITYQNLNTGSFILYQRIDREGNIYQVQIKTTECQHDISCTCAIAIRAAGDVFVIDRCQNNYDQFRRCDDNLITVKRISRLQYQINFPYGTFLDITLQDLNVIEVKIHSSLLDYDQSVGLCGTPGTNSLRDRNGDIQPDMNLFFISWRISTDENLIDMNEWNLRLLSRYQGIVQLCTCIPQNIHYPMVSNVLCSDEATINCTIHPDDKDEIKGCNNQIH